MKKKTKKYLKLTLFSSILMFGIALFIYFLPRLFISFSIKPISLVILGITLYVVGFIGLNKTTK